MASTAKPTPMPEVSGRRSRDATGVVEIDDTFGRMLGLSDGQKVGILLHLDPPLAHTVHVEPLTPADWEIIELHASFLESNLLFQVRALPNPTFTGSPSQQAQHAHPLTIHLSPTNTAKVIISSLDPPQSSSIPFAKIAPDGEVIVAPKARPKLTQNDRKSSRSITSTSRRSGGARSTLGSTRQRSSRQSAAASATFLRVVDRGICDDYFDEEIPEDHNGALKVWVDQEILTRGQSLQGIEWVCVSLIQPGGLDVPLDAQQQQKMIDVEASDAGKPSTKLVAKLMAWKNPPDGHHAALSSPLCKALDAEAVVGGLVRIEAAPKPLSRNEIERLKVYPFLPRDANNEGLKFGGQSKAAREAAAERFLALFASRGIGKSDVLDGPITGGLVLPDASDSAGEKSWAGGILKVFPEGKDFKQAVIWCMGSDVQSKIEMQPEISSPLDLYRRAAVESDLLPAKQKPMIGIDNLIDQVTGYLSQCSSVLLAGGLGSGKTSLARLLAVRLRSDSLYHTTYFSCRKLMTDETRMSTIKDTFNRLLMSASWGTKLGGRALVILDDLDKLCPVETELQTSDNGRSRQVSELLFSLLRQYCSIRTNVVVLATAQEKESLNSVIVSGNVFKEIIDLKVPDKDGRRQILQVLTGQEQPKKRLTNGVNGNSEEIGEEEDTAWMDGSPPTKTIDSSSDKIRVDPSIDFLDVAGQTDGYMPGDLVLLVSRTKNEALIRSIQNNLDDETFVTLTRSDFERALKGFTPASLRNVTLQSSKTTFDSIGGLRKTRQILLETLQYPTTYAPIFAQCPLRLRSGLLLYGYPGCGKTLLASAVAGECGLNFISVKGPEILNKYIGASEKSVRDLFDRAQSAKPCVLFFDEFDSIAPKRGHDSTGVTDRVVNQMLTQMDGAEGLSGVYVLAATSRPDLIDPALLRPGRLDKSLLCDMPSLEDRVDILEALSRKLIISPHILNGSRTHENLREVAHRTPGYSGADLQAVIYNAHLEAIHDLLGDHGTFGDGPNKRKEAGRNDGKTSNQSLRRDILHFRFGKDAAPAAPADSNTTGLSRAKEAAEYAAIIAKLDALKAARKKERQARRGGAMAEPQYQQAKGSGATATKGHEPEKVVIEWKHIEASLATTRSSIGADERRRLEKIYREFVGERDGDMRTGEGSTEVGGRSSLM